MKSVVRRWGLNLAVRIPPDVAKKAKLGENVDVEVEVIDGKLVITPLAKVIPIKEVKEA